jgi:hypothetical protein
MAADQLWRRYWRDDVSEIQHGVVADTADAYTVNAAFLVEKRRALRVGLVGVAVETVAIGSSIVASTFT